MNNLELFLILLVIIVSDVAGQATTITFAIDTGPDGLVYFLLVLFFALNMCTPVMYWLYHYYISKLAERAGKELSKMSKRMSDRMSDAGRKVSQSIRSA